MSKQLQLFDTAPYYRNQYAERIYKACDIASSQTTANVRTKKVQRLNEIIEADKLKAMYYRRLQEILNIRLSISNLNK